MLGARVGVGGRRRVLRKVELLVRVLSRPVRAGRSGLPLLVLLGARARFVRAEPGAVGAGFWGSLPGVLERPMVGLPLRLAPANERARDGVVRADKKMKKSCL